MEAIASRLEAIALSSRFLCDRATSFEKTLACLVQGLDEGSVRCAEKNLGAVSSLVIRFRAETFHSLGDMKALNL